MGLGRYFVPNWDTMKTKFLEKYQDYHRGVDRRRDDIFKMSQKEEPLEDYVDAGALGSIKFWSCFSFCVL